MVVIIDFIVLVICIFMGLMNLENHDHHMIVIFNKKVGSNTNFFLILKLIIAIKNKDLEELKKIYLNRYKAFKDDYFIFGGEKPLSTTTIDRYKRKACQKASLRPITQHQFRHRHASFLCSNGVPINVISARLGHSRISTTTDVYIHCNLEQQKRVSTLIDTQRNNFFKTIHRNFNKLFSILKHTLGMF